MGGHARSSAMAVLGIGNCAQKDIEMEIETQVQARELGESFVEVIARIDECRREANDDSAAMNAQMCDFHRETIVSLDTAIATIRRVGERSDVQFRWLIGLMITSLLATAGLFARAAHML